MTRRALVGAQLKDSLAMLRRCCGGSQLWPALKRDEQRTLNPLKRRRCGRRTPERLSDLHEYRVLRKTKLGCSQSLKIHAGKQQIKRRRIRTDIEMERTHGRNAEPVQRRDKRVRDVTLRKFDLRPGLQMILANLVELASFASSDRRLCQRRRLASKSKRRSCNGSSQKITPFHSSSQRIRYPSNTSRTSTMKNTSPPASFGDVTLKRIRVVAGPSSSPRTAC